MRKGNDGKRRAGKRDRGAIQKKINNNNGGSRLLATDMVEGKNMMR